MTFPAVDALDAMQKRPFTADEYQDAHRALSREDRIELTIRRLVSLAGDRCQVRGAFGMRCTNSPHADDLHCWTWTKAEDEVRSLVHSLLKRL